MTQNNPICATLSLLAVVAATGLLALNFGCDVQSGDDVVRNTQINIAGYYTNPDGGKMVSNNSGASVTALNILQSGNQIEAVDNNGQIFRGRIGSDTSTEATLVLEGSTTSGQPVTLTGKVTGSGNSGVLSGTWIEPTLYGSVYGKATIASISTNKNDGATTRLAISPSGSITLAVNDNRAFTASGGSKTYTWAISNTQIGFLSASTGATVTYTARMVGQQTVTVSDGSSSASTTVAQQL